MTTLSPGFDRAAIETQLVTITRDLLTELGNSEAAETVRTTARLDHDLGLGSIERVELGSRIERSLGISLPENVVADAVVLGDIVSEVLRSASGKVKSIEEAPIRLNRAEQNSTADTFVFGQARSDSGRAYLKGESKHGKFRGAWRALEVLYGIYAAGVLLIWVVVTWLIVLLMPAGRPAARMSSIALRLYFKVVGCRLTMEGREHVDAYGSCIYVSNHTSYSDVLVVMALFHTSYRFVAKSEINDMPFIGTFLRKLGHFSFERGKLRARSRQAEQMEKALRQGESLFVFAEGTFTPESGVRPFQLGAFRAAVKTGRPIVPVALRGARRFLRDGTLLPKPSRITVTVCPALFANPDSEDREWAEVLRLRDETRRVIAAHSGEPLLGRPAGAGGKNRSPS